MKPVVKVDRRGILAMARELQRYSPQSLEFIFRSEVGSIVKICLLRAKVASKAKVRRAVERQTAQTYRADNGAKISINGVRNPGRIWFVPPDATPTRGPGGNFFMVLEAGPARGWHIRDDYYTLFIGAIGDREGYERALIAIMIKRRGLLRQSWLQILDRLGVSAASIAPSGNVQESTVRAARGYRGRTYANGEAAVRTPRLSSLSIVVGNDSPLAIKRMGQAELDRATARRLKGFTIALKKGMLNDVVRRSSRWPGIFVSAN
jgi:hypothetical protein